MTRTASRRILGRIPLVIALLVICIAWTVPTFGVLVSEVYAGRNPVQFRA